MPPTKKMESINDELYQRIAESIELHKQASERTTICLPDAQRLLIRRALQYYRAQYSHFNSVPTDTERYEMFDLMTLQALFSYEVEVKLTNEEAENFTSRNGIDLPIYIK
jgi:hypothetical protein